MDALLTGEQRAARARFHDFVEKHVSPRADDFDRDEALPEDLIRACASEGYWGATVPVARGGMGMDALTHGLLCEAFGGGSISLLSILTVQGMVSQAVLRWGTADQRQLATDIARGDRLAAFALTEPEIGSDAQNITTTAVEVDGGYSITGAKSWISGALLADVFLVVAQLDSKPTGFLVDRQAQGLTVSPIRGMLGFRSAMLAELNFDDCRIPSTSLLGRAGFGLSHVAGTALDHGRFCIAWGSVGLAQACVRSSTRYAARRVQFGQALERHQLIQRLIADMLTRTEAARMLCFDAAACREEAEPDSLIRTSMAKYFASRTAAAASADAVQIHGANGCSDAYPVQRYFRDGKILEIIEGSNQMQQLMIAKYAQQQAS